jgi:hypothetical protein
MRDDKFKAKKNSPKRAFFFGDPTGIRTPVTSVKGKCPRPLDDRVITGLLVELKTWWS